MQLKTVLAKMGTAYDFSTGRCYSMAILSHRIEILCYASAVLIKHFASCGFWLMANCVRLTVSANVNDENGMT
ncbi:MAG: hypothetical protein R3Y10_01835 [Ferrimonas sp.]